MALLLAVSIHAQHLSTLSQCYGFLSSRMQPPQFTCGINISQNACFLLCGICVQNHLSMFLPETSLVTCDPKIEAQDNDSIFSAATSTIASMASLHGYTFLDDQGDVEVNATECLNYLLRYLLLKIAYLKIGYFKKRDIPYHDLYIHIF